MIEWDEAKNRLNTEKHGVDFETACRIFDEPVVTVTDDRFDYGEVRKISIGTIGGTVFLTVVHTNRNGRTRLISARRANCAEKRIYNEAKIR